MNPIEKIRNGIKENDMKKVAEGFNAMTGESVEPASANTSDIINRLRDIILEFEDASANKPFVPETIIVEPPSSGESSFTIEEGKIRPTMVYPKKNCELCGKEYEDKYNCDLCQKCLNKKKGK